MDRPEPLAHGELLTHKDVIKDHKHYSGNHEIGSNSLTMSPIEEEIYYYKWWNMAMVVEKGLEIRSKCIPPAALRCCGWGGWRSGEMQGERERSVSRRPRLLYIGIPSQKLFCLT